MYKVPKMLCLIPQSDVVKEGRLIEVHESAVVVDLLCIVVLGRVETVEGGGHLATVLHGLNQRTLLGQVNDATLHETVVRVRYPNLPNAKACDHTI